MSQSSGPPNPKRRHKPKFKLESIHVDELLNAAGMSGFLGVLEPPKPAAPHLKKLASEMLEEIAQTTSVPERYQSAALEVQSIEKGTPDTGTVESGIPNESVPVSGAPITPQAAPSTTESVIGIPERGVPDSGVPHTGVPHRGVPFSSAPVLGIPVSKEALPPPLILRRKTIRQAVLVQDGHSLGEQRIYETLWDNAHPYHEQGRIVTVGYRTLSQLSGLTVNNCKANIQSLIGKLAIEEHLSHSAVQGTTYIVYSYNSILKRRRQAGLTHYVKTRGVLFVNPETGKPLFETGIPESGTPLSQTGIPESGSSGIPESATPSIDISIRQKDPQSPSSSEVTFLAGSIAQLGVTVDDDLAAQLIRACRDHESEASVEDIRDFVDLKLLQIGQEVKNPGGYLLTAVPKCFTGEFYRQHIAQRQQAREQAEIQARLASQTNAATRVEMQRILDDPTASDEDKRFASRIIDHLEP